MAANGKAVWTRNKVFTHYFLSSAAYLSPIFLAHKMTIYPISQRDTIMGKAWERVGVKGKGKTPHGPNTFQNCN